MSFTVKSNTSSGAVPSLPYEQRFQRITYTDTEGTVGEHRYPINFEELYNLKGRLLTLVDATFTDPQQRKAHKDVVWQTLQHWMHDIIRAGGDEPMGVTVFEEHTPEP